MEITRVLAKKTYELYNVLALLFLLYLFILSLISSIVWYLFRISISKMPIIRSKNDIECSSYRHDPDKDTFQSLFYG